MSSDFIASLRERSPQACTASGRQLLVNDEPFLAELERHLDERQAVVVIRNLAATPCLQTRLRLRRFLSPLLSIQSPTNLHFQALCNLVQGYPDHARIVFPNVDFAVYDQFEAARALLFACIRCDDDCLAAFVERRHMVDLIMNVDCDNIEWALLTIRLLLQKSQLDRLLQLSTAQVRFALEALQTCLGPGGEIVSFAAAVLQAWRDEFGLDLLAQRHVPEAQLDLLYSAVSLATDAVIVPGAVVDGRLAALALDLLAACSRGDGPKPTRIGRIDNQPTTPRSMKAIVVRLLANLAGVDEGSRRRIGEDDALALLLNQTKIDDQNPFIREWVIVAIRHLTANDIEVQRRIAALQPTSFQTVPVQM